MYIQPGVDAGQAKQMTFLTGDGLMYNMLIEIKKKNFQRLVSGFFSSGDLSLLSEMLESRRRPVRHKV